MPWTFFIGGGMVRQFMSLRTGEVTGRQKNVPFLWFHGSAQEAVNFQVSIFTSSQILAASRHGQAGPGPKGSVMGIPFPIEGQEFYGLNGGPQFPFTSAISTFVNCETQEETGNLQEKFSAGGEKVPCSSGTNSACRGKSFPQSSADSAGQESREVPRVVKAMMQIRKLEIAPLQQACGQAWPRPKNSFLPAPALG